MKNVTLPREVFDELTAAAKQNAVILHEIYREIARRMEPRGDPVPPVPEHVRRLVRAIGEAQTAAGLK